MSNTQYIYTVANPGYHAFTMPDGFQSNVEVHLWGAGGGAGGGVNGGGGSYATTSISVTKGDIIEIGVGAAGAPAVGSVGGTGGKEYLSPNTFNGGDGGSSGDEDLDTGAGGGGGGASAVVWNGYTVVIAAGGGGAGGYGDDLGVGQAGYPGDVHPSVTSGIIYRVGCSAWCGFLNTYGIWSGGSGDVTTHTYTALVNFPTTGTYTFNLSTDNYGSLFVDSTDIINYSDYHGVGTTTAIVSAGNHLITLNIANTGGPAGIGAQILNPNSTELWNSTSLLYTNGLTSNSNGGPGGNGAAGGGGGGGGYLGGAGGAGTGDDAGGANGGEGGLSLGNTILPGSGIFAGGRTTPYAPVASYGNAGYNGYAVLVFNRKFQLYNKVAGVWTQIVNAWQKVNGVWTSISQAYLKNNGAWIPMLSTNTLPAAGGQIFNTPGSYSWTCPTSISKVKLVMYGAGGGGGGNDSHAGYPGTPGDSVAGILTVTPGTTYTISVGAAGAGGFSGTSNGGGRGGNSTLGYSGSRGGEAGGSGWSGGGGGGGAATTFLSGATLIALAGGGGGGGGGGDDSNGQGVYPGGINGTSIVGSHGIDHSGDGGGSGAGGGGYPYGGNAGASIGGDSGGYSGAQGGSLVPSGFTEDPSAASNGGPITVAGGNGYVAIYY